MLSLSAQAADFDVSFTYTQSRDFWRTVQDIQDQTGNLAKIQSIINTKYGKPDILYSFLDANYSYNHGWFDSKMFEKIVIGTRAEALVGGEISNPISPEIQAYANSAGIFYYGFRSDPKILEDYYLDTRLLGGIGSEKRLYAQGAEFIDAIPVRNGTLFLGGLQTNYINQFNMGNDFWVTSNILLRGVYFHSTTPKARSNPNEITSFPVLRWHIQNEWLKETNSFLSNNTRLGLVFVVGQNPYPSLPLPVTFDYQQKLKIFPGLSSVGGLGGIIRFLSKSSTPNFSVQGGYYGGAFGGGVDLQIDSFLLTASTYGIENLITPARDKTRVWSLSAGLSL